MKLKWSWVASLLLATSLIAQAQSQSTSPLERKEVQDFMQEMVTKHQFKESELKTWFQQAQFKPDIIALISRPYEALPWHRYKQLFVTEKHVRDGLAFWQRNQETLEKAEQVYGVPAEIIVAIIGVETRYGRHKGTHAVLDALSTLAFDYPPRARFFKSELEQFLLLTREQKMNPLDIKGSYAGAMGVPQFISSSYRHYAVDFSGNGQSDIINNVQDAIGSVANYFKQHGWETNGPVAVPATAQKEPEGIEQSSNNPKPLYRFKELKAKGIQAQTSIPELTKEKLALLSFEEQAGSEYWLGFNNFYVITRYNHSKHYAMAVYQLSQRLKQAIKQV